MGCSSKKLFAFLRCRLLECRQEEGRKEAFRHEVKHITGGDIYKEDSINTIEASCHSNTANFQINENVEIYVKDGE